MTDRNEVANHEKLIEWARSGNHLATRPGLVLELADALEAAEKAHTPTDDEREAQAITDADLDRIEGIADPIYRSTAEASRVSKYLVSDLGRWIVRLVAEVRRLRTAEAEDERIEAWHYVADHEAFKACYGEEQPLIDSVLARITQLHELESTVNELAPAPTLPLEPSDAPKVVTLDDVYEVTGLDALVAEARSRGEWCCENGCGSGACETCPCCSAGWCVSGVDGVPEDTEAREFWLEVAAEYNPVAAALRAAMSLREGEVR